MDAGDWISVGAVILAGLAQTGGIVKFLVNRINESERVFSERAEKLKSDFDAKLEAMRSDMSSNAELRTRERNDMVSELHRRVDKIVEDYPRRDEILRIERMIQAAADQNTNALNTMSQRIDSMFNLLTRQSKSSN